MGRLEELADALLEALERVDVNGEIGDWRRAVPQGGRGDAMSDRRRTIFAVSSGSYSDYSVHAIFEDREDAEKYIDVEWPEGGYDRGEVEEFDFYPAGAEIVRTTIYRASWGRDGSSDITTSSITYVDRSGDIGAEVCET